MERSNVGCSLSLWSTQNDCVLFNEEILNSVDPSSLPCYKNYGISHKNPGPGLVVRPLERGDFDKGYIDLLSQLTRVGEMNKDRYEAQFDSMKQCPGIHYVIVIEDTTINTIITTASLIVERKFVHSAALRGRIEDVVVHQDYRGKHLGCLILELLKAIGEYIGCYKLSLDCKPHLTEFYQRFGYKQETVVYMIQRFYD